MINAGIIRLVFQTKMITHKYISCICLLFPSLIFSTQQLEPNVTDMEKVYNALFGIYPNFIYNSELLPLPGQGPVNVNLELLLIEITNFDSVHQALTATVWLRTTWIDQRLKWDPNNPKFRNITEIEVSPKKIWTPDITLYNPADGMHTPGEDLGNQVRAKILHTGVVKWTPIVSYSVTCPVALKYFPFDVQVCHLKFGSWVHNTSKMYLNITDKVNIQYYKDKTVEELDNKKELHYQQNNKKMAAATTNNAWILHSTVAHENVLKYLDISFQDVKYFLILQRNYTQYLFNIIYTCMVLCFLCIFSFWVPVNAGERLSLSLSVLVAISVYQLLASDMIPTGTESTPIITTFLFGLVVLVAFSILMSMINYKLSMSQIIVSPPEWIFEYLVIRNKLLYGKWLSLEETYQFKNYVKAKEVYDSHWKIKKTNKHDKGITSQHGQDNDLGKGKGLGQGLQGHYDLNYKEKYYDTKWTLLSVALDRLSMVIYIITYIGLLVTVYIFRFLHGKQVRDIEHDIENVLRFL